VPALVEPDFTNTPFANLNETAMATSETFQGLAVEVLG
jgi:hypothetical protein